MAAIFVLAARLALAAIFLLAAARKGADRARWRGSLAGYALLPAFALAAAAIALPTAEIAIGLALVPPSTGAIAARAGLALLLVFTAAIAVNLARGRTRIDCGCGGAAQALSSALLARNAAVIATCLLATIPVTPPGAAWPIAAAAAAFAVLAYETAGQLLANTQSLAA
jgi:hypothetical protein